MKLAAWGDHVNVVAYSLELGGSVTDCLMTTILCSRSIKTHKLLVGSKHVDIDRWVPWFGDILGNTARDGDFEWARFCLENGANPNLNKMDYFKSVLAAVAENGNIKMAELLLEHGAWLKDSGAIVLAGEAGEKDMICFLLERGADIDEMGCEDRTDPRETEDMGSALHKAAEAGHNDVVEFLLKRGANRELKDFKGRTPSARAKEFGHMDIAELLQS